MLDIKVPEFPKKEFLLHNLAEELSDEQQVWWDAMVRLSDIISLTMQNSIERTSGKYLPMLFTEFLERLYGVVTIRRRCGKDFIFDDFVSIATFSVSALKHIVSSPSTQIEKRAEKVLVSQLHRTSSKTMQWMAKRPGRSVLEKIAPENKVMTSVTHFTADTKENRESLYLYNILHDIVRERVEDTDCLSCEYAASCGVPTKDIRDLLSLHTKIQHGDLSDVPAQKQTLQNNKLMCDKNYKMVWDAVKRLSQIEESLSLQWKELQQRYMQIGYWIVLSFILHNTDSVIIDCYGSLSDDQGLLHFVDNEGKIVNNQTTIFPATHSWEPLTLTLDQAELSLFAGGKEVLYLDFRSIKTCSSNPGDWMEFTNDITEGNTGDEETMPHDKSSAEEIFLTEENKVIPSAVEAKKESATEDYIEAVDVPELIDESKCDDAPKTTNVIETSDTSEDTHEDVLSPGDTVFLGHFPQTAFAQNDDQIEWQVYRVSEEGIAWLISKLSLERKEFHNKHAVITWEQSTLYKWLNSNFYEASFSEKEKKAMMPIDENGSFVTIISSYEAETYLGNPDIRCSAPSELAKAHGAKPNRKGLCPYWTRKIDPKHKQVQIISGSGNCRMLKYLMNFVSVRPVIAVKTEMFGSIGGSMAALGDNNHG